MNQNQKNVLICVIALILLIFLYPPFEMIKENGVIWNLGYSFMLSPPYSSLGVVNVGLLFMQFLAIVVAGVAGWLLFQSKE